MKHSSIPLAQTVVQLCKLHQITQIVISPGSRNAPLTISFTNDPFFTCYSIVDERCAGFFALGIAQRLKQPAIVVCTSGSAVVNYFPAVTEAYYSDIPLVVLSADRPKYLLEIGDGQTIQQDKVFDKHVVYSTNLKLDLNDEHKVPDQEQLPIFKSFENRLERFLGLQQGIQEFNEEEINSALYLAKFKKGPVHINVPFDEPLYNMLDEPSIKAEKTKFTLKHEKIDEVEIDDCVSEWNDAKRKMILVGSLPPNTIEQNLLEELADDDSVIVLTETTSNLYHPNFFPSIDKLIAPLDEDGKKRLQPDILLTFGGMVISKKIKALLRTYRPKQHWHVSRKKAYDTYFSLDKHLEVTPNEFLTNFLPKLTYKVKSTYFDHWMDVRNQRSKKHLNYVKEIPFCDFLVYFRILKRIPTNTNVHLGNSSTVRYAQLFNLDSSLNIYCNRGTSGIDGSTSTAVGSSAASEGRTLLITGDLSFFYDSNGLWNNYIPKNFRIILINNGGGGIFRILPGHEETETFDRFFETVHDLSAKQLCDMFKFDYATARNDEELQSKLSKFYLNSSRPKLLEIFTPREINNKVLLNYFDYLKA